MNGEMHAVDYQASEIVLTKNAQECTNVRMATLMWTEQPPF